MYIVRYWHPLIGCRAIELGKPPEGGVIFTPSPLEAKAL